LGIENNRNNYNYKNNKLKKIKISAVSYANTYPFLYGIDKKLNKKLYDLSLDVPSECARKLKDKEVDLGLIPVAMLPKIENAKIISEYCIGANGAVKTVLLMSKIPLSEIETVYLDPDSRTSVQLLKILAKKYWKYNWNYEILPENYTANKEIDSVLLIGDKTQKELPYKYIYDLAEEWKDYTDKPFVFAVWVANKELDINFINSFNYSINYGVNHISESINKFNKDHKYNLEEYLNKYISYKLTPSKRDALELYLDLINN